MGDAGRPYSAVVIPDDFPGYSHHEIRLSSRYQDYIESILVPNGLIKDRLEKMATDIINNLEKKKSTSLTLICILKGGFKFASDLSEKLEATAYAKGKGVTIHMDFIVASTYVVSLFEIDFLILQTWLKNDRVGHETQLRPCSDLKKFQNRDLLVVEDLIDTGTTLHKLVAYLSSLKPHSLEVASLLIKRRPDCASFQPDYVGFEVPDRFIVGYAIDYNDNFRELPHVCVINDRGKKQFAVTQ
ncbi:Hypoxanthine-guanine phosphoribosyltransferase [Paragonimus heterotremus]|uniref:Hypoxanthine-guanine phosphoribosyltransferase n=1 Tax=Paragonimus heterotremus TaxID=100268 RepID=A0A8J4T7U8_9TREM|nr:Hypoxanthine-guanine phosphoribosyltransferase [Paragonimus heterotremus]